MLREADKDKDGLLVESEWLGVELWFQYRAFQPGSEEDLEGEHALEQQAKKREAYDRWEWGRACGQRPPCHGILRPGWLSARG